MKAEDLKAFPYLGDLSSAELEMLGPMLEERQLAKGRRLVQEGQSSEGMILLTAGVARVEAESGFEGRLEAPAVLGATALVAVGTRALTAVADSPCTVAVLTRTAFHRLAEDAPRAAIRIMEGIAGDLATLLRQSLDHTKDE